MENRFGGLEEKIRKLLDMQSKTPPAVLMANLNQDLTGIPLAESKGKEIGREEFNDENFFHQEPSPGTPIRGRSGFPNEGTVMREFFGGDSRMVDHYERHLGQGEWPLEEGVKSHLLRL
ncbi:hypothetical protein IEQ34_011944 [Dendrobium chrysotoxum]|uniref:Uncharacterized protein n=1 Tax=Dendrobium chrysotoxum TaxID=161865 RepID=A0AAV7GSP8_DENCH|nr:hypothetical protein IEQ34_011944 [Dendrobium chrysotoxum]